MGLALLGTRRGGGGRLTGAAWERWWDFTRILFLTMDGFLPSFFEQCGLWWTRGSTRKDGRAIKWWISSESQGLWTSPQFSQRRTATLPGPRRRWPTSWASSSFASFVLVRSRS